jgi:hypothetical protein
MRITHTTRLAIYAAFALIVCAIAFALVVCAAALAFGAERSSKWDEVQKAYLTAHPTCEACGSKVELNVHHVLPFHLFPEFELEPSNLITLCKWHHMPLGHLGLFQAYNPLIREDAARHLARVKARPYTRDAKVKFEQAFQVAQ